MRKATATQLYVKRHEKCRPKAACGFKASYAAGASTATKHSNNSITATAPGATKAANATVAADAAGTGATLLDELNLVGGEQYCSIGGDDLVRSIQGDACCDYGSVRITGYAVGRDDDA